MGDAQLTVASWALGRKIAEYRKVAALTATEVAKALKVTQPTVTKIERGKHKLTPRQFATLCRVLSISPGDQAELEQVRVAAEMADWRQDYGGLLDGPFGDVLGLESGAASAHIFNSSFVPGVLQTAEYAGAWMRQMPYVRESEVERRVELRMRRQERVQSGELQVVAVVNWSAVEQELGDRAVQVDQVRRLRECMEWPNVIFRVVPASAGAYAGYGSSWTTLSFPKEIPLPQVVACDTLTSALIYEEPAKVEIYTQSFNMIWPRVLSKSATAKYLEKLARK